MSARDFCTVSQVKYLLPTDKALKEDDPFIQRLISAASQSLRNEIGDEINSASYSEVYDGTGTGKIVLSHQPVTAVASVAIGPPSGTRAALTVNVDYVFYRYGIQSLARGFPVGIANVLVDYTAGFVAVPDDISGAAAKLVALRYKEGERVGQSSKTFGGQTIVFETKDFPDDVMAVIEQYKRVAQVVRR